MMTFENFSEEIRSRVEAQLKKEFEVSIFHMLKNNSIVQPQLVVLKSGNQIGPAICLQDQYAVYMEYPDNDWLDQIVENIIGLYKEQATETGESAELAMKLLDYSFVREKILYKLVNTEDNQELLSQIPHIPYLDLSIVFYISGAKTEFGLLTVLINNEHMERWNVTADVLYQAAMKNMPEIMPARFCSMAEILFGPNEVSKENAEDEWRKFLFQNGQHNRFSTVYVLTNKVGIFGAAAILYPGILKKCSETFKTDMFILPSSTHEVLLIPYKEEIKAEELNCLVKSVNNEDVPREAWLSDHAYIYRREDDQVAAV